MKPYLEDADFTLWNGDVFAGLAELIAKRTQQFSLLAVDA